MRSHMLVHKIIVTLVMVYLFVPLVAMFLYSISTDWYRTILPEGYTPVWYAELFSDPRFMDALGRTLFVCFTAVIISSIVLVPTIFIVLIYFPAFERLLQGLVMLPYAIPGIVTAVALIKLYSSGPIVLSGTVWILLGGYFVLVLPYMYQGIRNGMQALEAVKLVEAAELLGANKMQAFIKVVLPNILTGILVSTLLSFSTLFGEFVLVNMLIGGNYETMQIYLIRRMLESGHLSSAIVVTYILPLFFIFGIIMKMGNAKKEGKS